MKILDTNNKFILALGNHATVYLIDAVTLQVLHRKEFLQKTNIRAASLQYGTGVAAICINSRVHFYDFFYQRQIDILDTYKPILKVCLRKNLLIIVSQDRILVYNVHKKENESYIQTLNGKLVFFDPNYTNLSIFYPEDHSVLVSKPIWSLKGWKCTNGVKYETGCYFDQASKIALALYNTLSFYLEGEMMKIYGFDYQIVDIKSTENPNIVFTLLENNQIFGQNITEQFKYEFQEVSQNGLRQIEVNEQPKSQKSNSYFWIQNGKIYHWIKKENEAGKLFNANIEDGIKQKCEPNDSKQKPVSKQKAEKGRQKIQQLQEKIKLTEKIVIDLQ